MEAGKHVILGARLHRKVYMELKGVGEPEGDKMADGRWKRSVSAAHRIRSRSRVKPHCIGNMP